MVYAGSVEKADDRVVVIGSGPPGAAAALFLARAGLRVLLLEAGLQSGARGLTVRVQGVTVAKRKGTLRQRDGVRRTGDANAQLFEELAPGGLSNHWSCAVPRFSAEDFDDAARGGEAHTWPVTYADLAPWYDQVEPLLHVAGPSESTLQLPAPRARHWRKLANDWAPMTELARSHGRSLVAMPYAYGADTTFTRSGTPFNSFVRLIEPELGRGKIEVRFGARAAGVEWSASKRRVEAVTYRDPSGVEGRVPCRAVVVAGGALNTPQVLLQSKSADFPDGLGNTHGVLGRYLHDHPLAKVVIDVARPMSIHPAAYLTRPELSRSKVPLYAAACMQWCSASDLAKSVLARHPKRLRTIGFSVFGTMAATRDNYVALDETHRGPDGTPGLELHIRHPAEALPPLEEARDAMLALLTAAGLDPQMRVWKVEDAGNSNHYGGSCRMHASPELGMVNAFGRLHAVANVAVADSSVFTTTPEKNPVLTSMALAARAADRLAQDLKSGDL
ncbi:MAG: glucose-methanol-choline oxidoreductase [Polyangiaceae bacterium]|nr:glucose-methanol-choline oxidoreductase [Polyangiaceae bacterium]